MKKQFGGYSTSGPRGCFFIAKRNEFYYNKGKTGKANAIASPVCVGKATGGKKTTPKKKPKKTTPKKKPAPKFALANDGKANCAGKGAPVKNIDGCKKAAKAMKKTFGSSGAYASYPVGCFVYNNKLYYNSGKTGKGNSRARPVCVGKATGGKKTTPKKKPKKTTPKKKPKKTTPKKKPAPKFAMAGSGKANCAGKGAPA